jgi:hypothetical protein
MDPKWSRFADLGGREVYEKIAAALPKTRAWLEPRRFVLPDKIRDLYPYPGLAFLSDLGQMSNHLQRFADLQNKNSDSPESNNFFLGVIHAMVMAKFPTYFLAEDIGQALLDTEPPTETKIEDIRFPYPAFRVFLPKGFLKLGEQDVVLLQVALMQNRNDFVVDWDAFQELSAGFGLPAPPAFEGHFTIDRPILYVQADVGDYGSPKRVFAPWEDMTLGRLVTEFREHEKALGSVDIADGESLLRFAVNLIMLLGWVPDEITNEKCVRKAQTNRKGEITKTELWEPRFIGRPQFKKTYPANPDAEGAPSRFDEVRRAHWKRQAHGPGHSLRKVIWVSLYRTKSREDRGLAPES